MTAPAAAATGSGRAPGWLRRHDPGLAAVRRAARVTIAAATGFLVCRYLLGDSVIALYAVFAAIAMGALSQVAGSPAQRTRTYAAVLMVGAGLVTLGTLLAVNTWAAAAGMLVVGFVVAYAGVGGPRFSGVASGLQLFYMLPCFPPYAPDTLGQRLIGFAAGLVLMAVADRALWPAPTPPDVAQRIGKAAGAAGEWAKALAGGLRSGVQDDAALGTLRDTAVGMAQGLRLGRLPMAERPAGPGRYDRSVTVAAESVRVLIALLDGFARLPPEPDGSTPTVEPQAVELLETVAAALLAVRSALEGQDACDADFPDRLESTLDAYEESRAARLRSGTRPAPQLRSGLTALAITELASILVLAGRSVLGYAPPADASLPEPLAFLTQSTPALWWRRIRAHLTPQSVYLQNAVRLAIGLAVARVVAGVFDLSHGFWVLLATLSLMRTSVTASRAALVPAFLGTMAGAVVAGLLLIAIGDNALVYAAIVPLAMIVAFAAGPLLGLAASQAGFTVVFSMVFAQVAPTGWRLAETRVVDVVVGGLIGGLIGAAVWPRGGGGEIRRIAAMALRAVADEISATARALVGEHVGADPARALGILIKRFEDTYSQFRAEPMSRDGQFDWLVVLAVVKRISGYARTLRYRYPPPPSSSGSSRELGEQMRATADQIAVDYRQAGDAVSDGQPPRRGQAAERRRWLSAVTPNEELWWAPEGGLRLLDAWGWLHGLIDDLERVDAALDPAQHTRHVKPTSA